MSKTQYLSLLAFLFIPSIIFTQQFGLKVGGNHSFMDESRFGLFDVDQFTTKGGWHIGVYGDIPLKGNFGMQVEALYNRKGVGIDFLDGNSSNANYEYFDLPVLIYQEWRGFQFQIGAAAGLIMNHYFYDREQGTRSKFDAGEWLRTYDITALGGIEYQQGRFQLGIRYEVALSQTTKNFEIMQANNVIVGFGNGGYHRNLMFSLGYTLLGEK